MIKSRLEYGLENGVILTCILLLLLDIGGNNYIMSFHMPLFFVTWSDFERTYYQVMHAQSKIMNIVFSIFNKLKILIFTKALLC